MVSLISAMIIQENNTLVKTYKSKNMEKYGYAITLNKSNYYRTILSCEPHYETPEQAKEKGLEVMMQIKELDLGKQRNSLDEIIEGLETTNAIGSINKGANEPSM